MIEEEELLAVLAQAPTLSDETYAKLAKVHNATDHSHGKLTIRITFLISLLAATKSSVGNYTSKTSI